MGKSVPRNYARQYADDHDGLCTYRLFAFESGLWKLELTIDRRDQNGLVTNDVRIVANNCRDSGSAEAAVSQMLYAYLHGVDYHE